MGIASKFLMSLKHYFILMRPHQWYKNILIFLPIIFVKELFNMNALSRVFIGFFALCFISSVNYILNDVADMRKDKLHPEKKFRPLPSGKAKPGLALIVALLFFVVSILFALKIGNYFIYFVLGLFLLTQAYTYVLKNEPFVDIIIIGINYILRALSGAFVIFSDKIIEISPWLILCPFFLALFLATGKRESNLILLSHKAKLHKKILTYYTKGLTRSLLIITTTALLICYALFTFSSDFPNLIYTLPFAVYIMFRYMYIVESGSVIARNTHLLVKDKQIMFAALIWAVVVYSIIYIF